MGDRIRPLSLFSDHSGVPVFYGSYRKLVRNRTTTLAGSRVCLGFPAVNPVVVGCYPIKLPFGYPFSPALVLSSDQTCAVIGRNFACGLSLTPSSMNE